MNVCRKPVLKKKPKFKKKNHYFFWRVIEIDPCQKKKFFGCFGRNFVDRDYLFYTLKLLQYIYYTPL